jgi:hypothetical protein
MLFSEHLRNLMSKKFGLGCFKLKHPVKHGMMNGLNASYVLVQSLQYIPIDVDVMAWVP